MIRNINQNYTKEVAKQVWKSTILTTKHDLMYYCTTRYQAINGVLELRKKATKSADILTGKKNIKILQPNSKLL